MPSANKKSTADKKKQKEYTKKSNSSINEKKKESKETEAKKKTLSQEASSYATATLNDFEGSYESATVKDMITDTMHGIEGLPYQFMSSVDRRISGTSLGRKFGEKIIAKMPLLFLTPCKPKFMDDFDDNDKSIMAQMLAGLSGNDTSQLIEGKGRYYSVEFDYTTYYQYLNGMMSSVVSFAGLYDERVNINGKKSKLGTFSWQNDTSDSFKSYFSSQENIVFYLDGMNSVSESFSNSTTESSLASQINGYTDTANEIKFLIGEKGFAASFMDRAIDTTSSITSALSGVIGNLGGGIAQSLADKGVNTILNGGKIIFPEIWADSSYDKSYNINIKLRSPDHDTLSIILNIVKPFCKLLTLVLPRLMNDNPNGYTSPFLVKAYCKGLFNIDMGIITSMSVTKGDEGCWNDDGLPTQLDISLEIKDLYSSLAMSGFKDSLKQIVNNTSYMDYLANMAGLNIAQMEIGRRVKMYYYLAQTEVATVPSTIYTMFNQTLSKIIGGAYKFF